MQQMVLDHPGASFRMMESAVPQPLAGQVLLRVQACAVCDIDSRLQQGLLHGETFPLVLGHEVIGAVEAVGDGVAFRPGQRLGVGWLGASCGHCEYCVQQQDHLCAEQRYMGMHLNGGYATHVLAEARHCFAMDTVRIARSPARQNPGDAWTEAAAMTPLLCEGALAYRCHQACGAARTIGLYGFGTAAQLVCQMAVAKGQAVHAMTRPGGEDLLELARDLGAEWTGTIEQTPPVSLDAAILLQPTVELVPHALKSVRKDGVLVFLGMHASRVPSFPYDLFLEEHRIHSISRSTRADMEAFLQLCSTLALKTRIKTYPLAAAGQAMQERYTDRHGESVLVMN